MGTSVHLILSFIASLQVLSTIVCEVQRALDQLESQPRVSQDTDYCSTRVDSIIILLDAMIVQFEYSQELVSLRSRALRLQFALLFREHTNSTSAHGFGESSLRISAGRGRPRIMVNVDQVEMLRSAGYTWNEIADAFLVSRSTIWRRIRESGICLSSYTDISDNDLDQLIGNIRQRHPHSGQNLIQGLLLSMNVHVQRYRIRSALHRVDPLGAILRRNEPITRRRYAVPGPNSLWHVDGHHSLIRWGFVVHGGMDGFSRLVVYLYCSTNNRSDTVLDLFLHANTLFGVPSRVRSDRGGENVGICEFMVSYRGVGRASHIAGSSVHNQRIERLWRDVFRCVCSTFHSLFYHLEASGCLIPDDLVDRYVLHYLFLPRINVCLTEFACGWNHHPIRTEHNWSPRRMWFNGMVDPSNVEQVAIRDVIDPLPAGDVHLFGVDNGGPLPADLEENSVVVDDVPCPLNEEDEEDFIEQFDPLDTCSDYGIFLYQSARQYVRSCIQAYATT